MIKSNRDRQHDFYSSMVECGYKRRHTWISNRAQTLLDELSKSYSKEVVIEEALELLSIAKKRLPDEKFEEPSILRRIKPRMRITKRNDYDHFTEALIIAGKRRKIISLWIAAMSAKSRSE